MSTTRERKQCGYFSELAHGFFGRPDLPESPVRLPEVPEEHKKLMADMALTIKYMDPVAYAKHWEEYETMVKELMPLTKE